MCDSCNSTFNLPIPPALNRSISSLPACIPSPGHHHSHHNNPSYGFRYPPLLCLLFKGDVWFPLYATYIEYTAETSYPFKGTVLHFVYHHIPDILPWGNLATLSLSSYEGASGCGMVSWLWFISMVRSSFVIVIFILLLSEDEGEWLAKTKMYSGTWDPTETRWERQERLERWEKREKTERKKLWERKTLWKRWTMDQWMMRSDGTRGGRAWWK